MELNNRYDFTLIFDVLDGNPNGDPDAGNLPRIDAETGNGIVTDVCLKRKIRNYVSLVKGDEPPFEIYIKERAVLNSQNERAYTSLNLNKDASPKEKSENVDKAREWMCQNFYDIRTFGAVMSTGINCGQVRGPVQLTFARSVEPVVTLEHSITRMAVTKIEEAEKQAGDNRTMGRKFTIPYGLYVAHGFVSAPLAKQTKFTEEDLNLLWDALVNMFDHDRSASRGFMNTRSLIIFKHNSIMGNAQADELFDRIKITKKSDEPARSFSDYKIDVDSNNLPSGIEIIRKK